MFLFRHLNRLVNLRNLDISGTRVTADAVKKDKAARRSLPVTLTYSQSKKSKPENQPSTKE